MRPGLREAVRLVPGRSRKVNILYFDIDGGRGGSGRSLYYLLKNLDREKYVPRVIMGREGVNASRYEALRVGFEVQALPRATSWRRRNAYSFLRMVSQAAALARLIFRVSEIHREWKVDCIHYNHESLFYIAWWIKKYVPSKAVFHVRTQPELKIWARFQWNLICKAADHIIFITENERDHAQKIVPPKKIPACSIVYNIAEGDERQDPPSCASHADGPEQAPESDSRAQAEKFRGKCVVLSLSNLSWLKGVDRLVEVADCLKRRGEKEILFLVCGRDGGAMREIGREIKRKGLQEYFHFAGWQKDPGAFLRLSDAVINLTRQCNPWGRDTIEAMAYGKPVISLGTYSKFLEHDVTGVLLPEYSAERVAGELIRLRADRELRERLGRNAEARARVLFDGRTQARRVEEIYDCLRSATS